MDTPSNRFCSQCASLIPDGAEVCPFCGSRQDTVQIWIDTEGDSRLPPDVTKVSSTVGGDDPLIGTLFDSRYRILDVIGQGGMATVYRARQIWLKRTVALKVFHTQFYEAQKIDHHFQNEAQAMGRVRHPYIVSVYEIGESNGSHYIAMKYIEGDSLKQLIQQQGSLSWQTVCEIGMQVGKALQHVHDRSLIHGDVKPENIIITKGENRRSSSVKILDFGTSRPLAAAALSPGTAHRTSAEGETTRIIEVVGTPEYMAPELLSGGEVDHRSDIYSLGVVLYLMLSGGLPSKSRENRACFVMNSTRKNPYKEASDMDHGVVRVPDDLGCLIMSMMEENVLDRPQSMREVTETLRGVAHLMATYRLPLSSLPAAPREQESEEPEEQQDDTMDISVRSILPPPAP